jgi:hypothetical protein
MRCLRLLVPEGQRPPDIPDLTDDHLRDWLAFLAYDRACMPKIGK